MAMAQFDKHRVTATLGHDEALAVIELLSLLIIVPVETTAIML